MGRSRLDSALGVPEGTEVLIMSKTPMAKRLRVQRRQAGLIGSRIWLWLADHAMPARAR